MNNGLTLKQEHDQMTRIKLMNAELDACAELSKQYRRITLTPVVDDDFPEVKFDYDRAVQAFLAACKANGRTM